MKAKPSLFLRFLPLSAVLALSPHAIAADYYFEGNGGTNRWNDNDVFRNAASGGAFISANPSTSSDMYFNITGLNTNQIITTGTAASNRASKTLNFNSTGTTTIQRDIPPATTSSSGQNFSIQDGIIINSGAGAVTIGVPDYLLNVVALDDQLYIQNDASSLLTFDGTFTSQAASGTSTFALTGSGSGGTVINSVIENGASALTALSIDTASATVTNVFGSNTYTGGTTLDDGILVVNASNSLGTGAITLNGGRIGIGASGIDWANDVIIGGNVIIGTESGISGNASGLDISGTVSLDGGTRVLTVRRTLTVSGVISSGGLTFNGVGSGDSPDSGRELRLNGVNTYAGATTITSGTLVLGAGGSIDNTSGVSLGTDGTFDVSAKAGYTVNNLTGSGTVIGSLTVSTELAIGNSPGTTDFEDLTLGSASTYTFELAGGSITPTDSDLGNVSGTLILDSGAALDLVQLGTYTVGDKFTLFAYETGSLTGTFAGKVNGATFTDAGGDWQIDYFDNSPGLNGGTGTSFVTVTAVPEPAAALLGSLGLLALLRRRRA